MEFNHRQKAVGLPNKPICDGDKGIVAGWGYTRGKFGISLILQKLTTKVYSGLTCTWLDGILPFDDKSRICTFSGVGKGFCEVCIFSKYLKIFSSLTLSYRTGHMLSHQ